MCRLNKVNADFYFPLLKESYIIKDIGSDQGNRICGNQDTCRSDMDKRMETWDV
mgnify:CR=1 FL=1